MSKTILAVPILAGLALLARAGDPTPDDLVGKLADESYEVREQATKDLVAMGEKAVPALEKALQSEDLEVRLRAGRALRAIRGGGKATGEPQAPGTSEAPAPSPGLSGRSAANEVQVQVADGRVKVRVRSVENGQETVKEYEGESIEQLKKEHPELEKSLGNLRFQVGPSNPMERDDFWKSLFNDEDKDLFREMEQLRRQMIEDFRRRQDFGLGLAERQRDATALRSKLGVLADRPDPVLDDHLDLRGRGLVVREVMEGGVAERLGLRRFDVLVQLNGVDIGTREDVAAALGARKEGEPMSAVVFRKAKRETLTAPR